MSKRAPGDETKKYGLSDEALKSVPTVFRDGLLDGQVALVSGAGSGLAKPSLFCSLGLAQIL